MNGLWKEEIGGYNNKGIRRKRQSRKHTLKDKYNGLENAYWRSNKNIIYDEGEIEEILSESTFTYSSDVEVWSIEISKFIGSFRTYDSKFNKSIYSRSIRKAYYWYGWYDIYSHELICLSSEARKLDYLYTNHMQFEKPLENKPSSLRISKWNYTSKKFVYGKPVPYQYTKDSYTIPSNLRKEGQCMVNRRDRMNLKQYIHNADWDKSIKTHRLSKDFHFFYWLMY